jgi:tetratricopeptide (TPR) repeat protein
MTLGLLAKPMLVSLPFVFLLLDYWPMGRFLQNRHRPAAPRLLLEKMPFFLLAGLFCILTVLAQWRGKALRSLSDIPFLVRCENIPVAYLVYLRKMFWPFDLSPFWALSLNGWPAWETAAASFLLAAITVAAWKLRAAHPYFLVGWLWYVGTLVPVIGIVQVGDQAWSDRYTYLPLIGIFISMAWGTADLLAGLVNHRAILASLGVATVLAVSVLTRMQAGYWQDDFHLWQHTLEVQPNSDLAQNNLGAAFSENHEFIEAYKHYSSAVAYNPSNGIAQLNLARTLANLGRNDEAMDHAQRALDLNPESADAHGLLGRLLIFQGQVDKAIMHLQKACRLRPEDSNSYLILGEALMVQDNPNEAVTQISEGVRLAPGSAIGFRELGMALGRLHRWPEAAANLQRAVELRPDDAEFRCDLALALHESGEREKAAAQYANATKLKPDWTSQSEEKAGNLLNQEAINGHLRHRALELSLEICQATDFRNAQFLCTLAAAYQATGERRTALDTAHRALELAISERQDDVVRKLREQIEKIK